MGGQDESQKPAAVDASAAGELGDGEEFFEAAVRGSVEELLDAGAHGEERRAHLRIFRRESM